MLMCLYFISSIIQTEFNRNYMIFFLILGPAQIKKLTYVLFAGLVNIYIYICSCYKTWLHTKMRKVNAQILASVTVFSFYLAASTKIPSKNLI